MDKNLKTSLISGIMFASIMTIYFYSAYSYKNIDIICIRFLGCLFFWTILIYAFISFQSKKLDKISKDIEGNIIYKGLANHFVGIEGVGGHLFITEDKLIFKSHNMNIHNHSLEILCNDIKEIKLYNNLVIIQNGITILHKNGVDKFVVNDRKKIVEILNYLGSSRKLTHC